MNIFSTKSVDAVHEFQFAFDFRSVRELIYKRKPKFLADYKHNANLICSALERQASSEQQAMSDQLHQSLPK